MRWRLAAAIFLALSLGVAAGCDDSRGTTDGATSPGAASPSVEATVAAPAPTEPGAVGADASDPAAAAGSPDAPSTATTAADQEAIERELAAIIRELDAMSLPGDADFSDIEGALGQ